MPHSIEVIRKRGKILADFANAKTTDEACLTYFRNIKDLLSFSPAFGDSVKELFPFLSTFLEPLKETERKIFDLIPKERQLLKILNEQFGLIGYDLKGCDTQNKTLSLSTISYVGGVTGGEVDFEISEEGPFAVRIDELNDEIEDFEILSPDVTDNINELMTITESINALKSEIPESRFRELLELLDKYDDISKLHRKIKNIQKDYISILEMIVEGKSLRDIPLIYELIKTYYSMPTTELKPKEDFLEKIPPIRETSYQTLKSISDWYILQKHLAYFMVEYFFWEQSRKYLRQCNKCKKYYVARKNYKRNKFCSDCSPKSRMSKEKRREYQKKYRQNKKQERLTSEREARIKTLMNNLDCNREEAIDIIEADASR